MRYYFYGSLRGLIALIAFGAAALSGASPVTAQGFFERLFGSFSAPSSRRPVPYRVAPQRRRDTTPYPPYAPHQYSPTYRSDADQAPAVRPRMSRRYRTVCVRMCDGYYFPISHGVSRRRFYHDANVCESRCSGQSRLFFMPAASSRIEDARDQSGLQYKRLESAFLYRKKYVAGCGCRPKPWSHRERARHEGYADEEKRLIAEKKRRAKTKTLTSVGGAVAVKRQSSKRDMAIALPPGPDGRVSSTKQKSKTKPVPVSGLIPKGPDMEAGMEAGPKPKTKPDVGPNPKLDPNLASSGSIAEQDRKPLRVAVRDIDRPSAVRPKRKASERQRRVRRVYRVPRQRVRRAPRQAGWFAGYGGRSSGYSWPGDN